MRDWFVCVYSPLLLSCSRAQTTKNSLCLTSPSLSLSSQRLHNIALYLCLDFFCGFSVGSLKFGGVFDRVSDDAVRKEWLSW